MCFGVCSAPLTVAGRLTLYSPRAVSVGGALYVKCITHGGLEGKALGQF